MEDKKEEFSYSEFWQKQEQAEELRVKKEIEKLPKGEPRKGINGRYIKPKNYRSRKASLRDMKSFVYKEKNPD